MIRLTFIVMIIISSIAGIVQFLAIQNLGFPDGHLTDADRAMKFFGAGLFCVDIIFVILFCYFFMNSQLKLSQIKIIFSLFVITLILQCLADDVLSFIFPVDYSYICHRIYALTER